jgi:phage shock protein C
MNERLYRSVDDRVIAGVCGGLAARLAVDPSLVRVAWAILALVTGIFPLLVVYVIMAAVVPEDPKGFAGAWPSPTPPGAPGEPGPAATAGAGAGPADATTADATTIDGGPADETIPGATATAPAATPWYQGAPPQGGSSWERRERNPLLGLIGGLALVALGIYFLVRDRIDVDWGVVGAAGLVAVGAVVIIAALRPRR